MLGKLITFEGGDGAGKSTQIHLLAEHFKAKGIECITTREPGGSAVSEEIRNILLSANTSLTDVSEALLIAAARMQHVHDLILPNMQVGKIVLCDRYIHSTYAYQGYGRGINLQFLQTINMPAIEKASPNFTFLLQIEPKVAFLRKNKMAQLDRIEQAGLAFHEKVYQGYATLARQDSSITVLDASLPAEEIHAKILQKLQIE